MLHACFYTIYLVFRYTLWHFYVFSRTNLSMDFVSQEHGVPRDGPEDSNAGG
jgi:hypothetical protein